MKYSDSQMRSPNSEEFSPSSAFSNCAANGQRQLQKNLILAVSASPDKKSLLTAIGKIIDTPGNSLDAQYFNRNEKQNLTLAWQRIADENCQPGKDVSNPLLILSEEACSKGELRIDPVETKEGMLRIAAPVFLRNRPPEALAITIPASSRNVDQAIAMLQLAASHVTMWNMLNKSNQLKEESLSSAALLEIITKVNNSSDYSTAGVTLVSALQQDFQCQQVAIGLTSDGKRRCKLFALSSHSDFDRNSSYVRSLEAALDEAVLRDSLAIWSDTEHGDSHATRAQQRVCLQNGSQSVISSPLVNDDGEQVGAWLFLGDREFGKQSNQVNRIQASAGVVSSTLQLLSRADQGLIACLTDKLSVFKKTGRIKIFLVVAALSAAILMLPLHYSVKCACQLQPFTHRFIAAPFDGRLEKSFVGPGDIITQDTVLANLEGRDIRWELAGVQADYAQAVKERNAALASHEMVTAQTAKLESNRLKLKIKILEERIKHLEIKSPIAGIVISGDQERAEGAPLTTGQMLFEVAPLDKMVVELAIPEDEITYTQKNLTVEIKLDAFPRSIIHGTISKIFPRSEIQENQNVFIAEVLIENMDGTLRPGMNGHAKIRTARHPLGWNLFHKPWYYFISMVGL